MKYSKRILARGHFSVSHGHKLYFELKGNPRGIPLVFFHGGPGGGFDVHDERFFDLRKYKILFFCQRGAGKSKPFASLSHNSTDNLVKDCFALMDHCDIKRAVFFGGSWGATLALVAAIRNPERVSALVLRGVFLANRESLRYSFSPEVQTHFPDAWEQFSSAVPNGYKRDPLPYYLKNMLSGTRAQQLRLCYEWRRFETKLVFPGISESDLDQGTAASPYQKLARLEAHYFSKACFLPNDYILKNASRLSAVPTLLIHGRQDFVCRPLDSFRLHKKIKGSRLQIVEGGHSSRSPAIEAALCAEMKRIAGVFSRVSKHLKSYKR